MSCRACWKLKYSYLRLAVCLLLVYLPPSFPAIVFQNDVLSNLDKYKMNGNSFEHTTKAKSTSTVFSPSGITDTFHSEKVTSLPAEALASHHTYPEPQRLSGHQDVLSGDLFHPFPSISEKAMEEDYYDYSDYSLSQSPVMPTSKHTSAEQTDISSSDSNREHSSKLPSSQPAHKHTESTIHKGQKASGGHDKKENKTGQEHHGKDTKDTDHEQCPVCKLRDEDRAYRIESLKRKILDSLHFTTLPNRTGIPVPKALAHMAGIHSDLLRDAPYGDVPHHFQEEEDDDFTPPERVFTTAKPLPPHLGKERNACYFQMPNEVFQSRVTKAYLWFYVRRPRDFQSTVIQMKVNRLGPPTSRRQRSSKRIVWSQKTYPDRASGWKKVDLTSIVKRWVKHPSSNYGLQIQAFNRDDNLAVLPPTPEEYDGYEPTIDISVTKDSKHRYRRSDTLICSENTTEHRCCRYPLSVSFAEFGWTWVIAPTHVRVDYCSGECRMTLQNETPYSWITSQMPEGGSCCTPSKMSELPLLYFNHRGDVVFQMLQNMRVERCACA